MLNLLGVLFSQKICLLFKLSQSINQPEACFVYPNNEDIEKKPCLYMVLVLF